MLVRLGRVAGVVLVVGFALFALVLLAVRFIVFPQVEAFRDTLTAALTRQLGQPVEIAALSTGWDGWNPKIVIEGFRVQDRARIAAAPLLELPEVDLIIAWTSLPLMELRLKQLVIERPRLGIRRDRAGILHIAGIEIDPSQASDDSPVTDWILRQRQIVIRDALVTWNDDLRNAPQLVLDRVQFRLESRFGHHRFGLKGTPPPELAAPIDLRGDVRGSSLKEWQGAEGRLYVRLDYADVTAWREWLPLPVPIASGKGALRVWFEFAKGEARGIVADLELAEVKAQLGDKLPQLDLVHLSGRIGWRHAAPVREIFTRELAFVTANGQRLEPTDFALTLRDATDGGAATGRVDFDRLQLEPLRDLAANLPLPERWRAELARYAPRGALARGHLQWEGPAEAPTAFSASSEFANLGIVAQDALPGASGLTGSFAATHRGGEFKLASSNASLELPRVFRDAIALDALRGTARWERIGGQTAVKVERLEFANAHTAGSVMGTYRTAAQGPGEIDFTGQLTRADIRQVHHYLPLAVDDMTRDWLRTALTKGTVTDTRLKLAGNLAQFPFADGKGGQLVVTAKARAATLAYVELWPAIEEIDADIKLEGARLMIDATRGRTFGAEFGKTHAEISDLRAAAPLLTIGGSVSGPAADFLRFVDQSPVAAWSGHITDGAEVSGNARIDMKLELPLGHPEATRVAGEFTLANAQLRFAGVPPLSQVNGKLGFTENDVRARDIALDTLGGPAKFAIASVDGKVRVTGGGTANLATLRREHAVAHLDRLSGNVDWTIDANVRPGLTTWVVDSTMKGGFVDLPAPLGKAAADAVPLRIERAGDAARPSEDFINVTYGRVAQFAAYRKQDRTGFAVERALLSLGRASERSDATHAERPGLWVRAELPVLNVDDWLALYRIERTPDTAGTDDRLAFAGVDLDVGALGVFGRSFSEMKVVARAAQGDWRLDLRGGEIVGTATWSTPSASVPNGRVVARLARLATPAASEFAAWGGSGKAGDPKAAAGAANPWPEIDVAADSFSSHGHDLGRLEFVAKPRDVEWRIERLAIVNDSGRIDADGAWRTLGRQQQTKLDVALDAKDPGGFLARFGFPDALQDAPTKINGQLAWSGAPSEFDYPTLTGTFRIAVGPGRFTKIEPGIGKLLGVLSLQALPRRITLDFRDVFSEGFAFDEITGTVRVFNGVMSTDNLKLVGPTAKVDIAGDADLAKETQRLTVRVQPALSAGVSAGAALLFLANPIIGAAVGAGSLLAQKVLQDPFEQMFSYRYTVTGGWSDPVVARSGTGPASVAPGTPGTPVEGTGR